MGIRVYTVCWNEIRVIEFYLRHYERFAERIIVYDEDSDDGTQDVLLAHPKVELRRFIRTERDSLELSKKAVHDKCWKEARGIADWVILVDVDEHIHHPDIATYLAEQSRRGVTFVPTLGFQMICDVFPNRGEYLARTRTIGSPSFNLSKPVVFNPAEIDELGIAVGQHSAVPSGRISFPEVDEVMLLHYKHLSFEYAVERYRQLSPRVGSVDLANSWDFHFHVTSEQRFQWWAARQRLLVDISAPDFAPAQHHSKPSWRDRSNDDANLVIRGLPPLNYDP
jgi:glycosyltransferase involved in cell wall biosynthesis